METVNPKILSTEAIPDGKVRIKPDESGNILRMLKNLNNKGEEQAYIVLRSYELHTITKFNGTNMVQKGKQATLFGTKAALETAIKNWSVKGSIPGRIVIKEVLESEFRELFPDMDDSRIEMFYKRAGHEGPLLKVGEDIILSNNLYTLSADEEDQYIAHTNRAEVLEYNKALKMQNTSLDNA